MAEFLWIKNSSETISWNFPLDCLPPLTTLNSQHSSLSSLQLQKSENKKVKLEDFSLLPSCDYKPTVTTYLCKKNLNLSQSVLAVVRLALSPLSWVPTNRAQEEGVRREREERNIFNVKCFHRPASSLLPLSRPSSRLFALLQWKYMKSYITNTRHFSLRDHGETLRPGDEFLQIFLQKNISCLWRVGVDQEICKNCNLSCRQWGLVRRVISITWEEGRTGSILYKWFSYVGDNGEQVPHMDWAEIELQSADWRSWRG